MEKSARAFTLIELLIVVSIIIIMTATLVPSFDTYIKNQGLRQAQENIKSDLRTAQNKAMTGVGADLGVEYWGIRFTNGNDEYEFFNSTTTGNCTSLTASSFSEKLPGNVVINTTSTFCVYFSMYTGNTSDTTIRVKEGSSCKRVEVNSAGLITSPVAIAQCQ